VGYGFRAFTAVHHTLDGVFGAVELSPVRAAATQLEYDSEKWNLGASVALPWGLQGRVALLRMRSWSLGAGWTVAL